MKTLINVIFALFASILFMTTTAQSGNLATVKVKLDRDGYHNIKVARKRGKVYKVSACKRHRNYKLRVNHKGRVLKRRYKGHCVKTSNKKSRNRVRVSAPYSKVRVKGRKVAVSAPYTQVRVKSNRVRVRAPYVNLNISW